VTDTSIAILVAGGAWAVLTLGGALVVDRLLALLGVPGWR
jgi:hypothetical protein